MTTEERPRSGVAANGGHVVPAGERSNEPSGFGRSSVLSAARERYDDDWYEEYIKGAVDMNGPIQLPLVNL